LAIAEDREGPGDAVERWCSFVAPVTDGAIMTKTATPACSAGDRHNHMMHVPPLSYVGSIGLPLGGRGRSFRGVSSIVFLFLLSLSLVPRVLSLIYKREGRVPLPRILFQPTEGTSTPLHFHQRPRSSSLSRLFVTPTIDPSASNTSNLPLDVGTFNPNQYISSCTLYTPSEPKHAIIEIY
jgi:hypothetical protein